MKELNKLRILILLIGTLLFVQIIYFDLHSQDINNIELIVYEDSLSDLFHSLETTKSDSEKISVNNLIINNIFNVLELDNSFTYPFDSINKLGKITSDDNRLRIYTWNIAFSDFTYKYYTILQVLNENENLYQVYLLNDNSSNIENSEKANLTVDNWYGALYYQIVVRKKRMY